MSVRLARTNLLALLVVAVPTSLAAQTYSVADVLSPGYPYELVSAADVDRIAWIEYERGMRNVWSAAAPDFEPVRLTEWLEDDGVDLSGLQISDDGRVATFIRGHGPNREGWVANPASDPRGSRRVVWAASTLGGDPWPVVDADRYTLSPDGRWVIYPEDDQIHRAAVNPGARETDGEGEPFFIVYGDNRDPTWSPDGRHVAFESRRDDHSFIGIYDTQNPGITYLAPGVDRDTDPAWSPDGTRVAFLRRPGLPFGSWADRPDDVPPEAYPEGMLDATFAGGHELEIWVADVQTGEGERIWHTRADDPRFEGVSSIAWVGDHLLFEAEPGNWRHWFSIAVDDPDPEPTLLTPGEGFAEQVAFSKDGRTLYYASNASDVDRRDLWRVAVAGGEPERLTRGAGIETYPAALASDDRVAVLYAGARRPLSVALVPSTGGDADVITSLPPEFPFEQHVEPTNVTIAAEDGLEFHNQLFLPPDLEPGERRPAVIFIHGGSRRQMLLGYHYRHFYHMAYAFNQFLASRGYVVLSVNYRSGIGYGKEFRNADDVGRRGNAEYRDILAAGQYLQSRPDVDPDRVGLWGLSYGGVLTAQALARNSDIFRAGVDMAGVHLWGGSIDPDAVSYQSSAISEIEKWRSPVLLMHGDDDRNVDFSQTVGLVQLLRAHDVPFELIVFPDDVHDSLLFRRWIQAFEASDDFLERTLVRGQAIATEEERKAGGG